MNGTDARKPSLGDEMRYRRNRLEHGTGSLVFDRHRDDAVAEGPGKDAGARPR